MDINNVNGIKFRFSAKQAEIRIKSAEIKSAACTKPLSITMKFLINSAKHLKNIKVYVYMYIRIYIVRTLFRELAAVFPLKVINDCLFPASPKTMKCISNVNNCGSGRLGAAWGGKVNPNTQPRK